MNFATLPLNSAMRLFVAAPAASAIAAAVDRKSGILDGTYMIGDQSNEHSPFRICKTLAYFICQRPDELRPLIRWS